MNKYRLTLTVHTTVTVMSEGDSLSDAVHNIADADITEAVMDEVHANSGYMDWSFTELDVQSVDLI